MKSIAEYNAKNSSAPTASASLARGTGQLAIPAFAPKKQNEGFAKCARNGCKKVYKIGSNDECRYHPGQPIFGGNEKKWNCCPQHAFWEFDLFQKIEPCSIESSHIDECDVYEELIERRKECDDGSVGMEGNVHAAMGYDGRRVTTEYK